MRLFVFGLGYSALAFIHRARYRRASGTVRSAESAKGLRRGGIEAFGFDGEYREAGIAAAIAGAEIVLVSAPPDAAGDPALGAFARELAEAPKLARILYLSTVGVYGGAEGDWVDETAPPLGASPRAHWRIAAEARWRELGAARGIPVDILRLAGIYGPGRNALVRMREGSARRIVKSGQVFNRIHVADIADVALRLIAAGGAGGVWNVADREPAPPQDVIAFAAELLGLAPPPEEPFETAELSPMARSFYGDNRRVCVGKLERELNYRWNYPSYREGLLALLEAGEGR